ncbi:MAG: divergent PAP2 family protein [Caldisericaceae bacterium]
MKNILIQLISNDIFIASAISSFVAQLLKVFVMKKGEPLDWSFLFSSGGNPSSHTSAVTTLSLLLGVRYGFDSPYFTISMVFGAIVVVDALSVRREVGKHSKTLNEIFTETALGKRLQEMMEIKLFKELIGHTGIEVFFGFLVGIAVAAVDILIVKH